MIALQIKLDLLEQLQVLLQSFFSKVPNLLGALLLFIIGWIIAKLIARIVARFFRSIKIDRLADRLNEIDLIEKSRVSIVPSKILSKIIYYMVFLIFIIAGTDVLGMPELSSLVSDIINYIPVAITAMVLLVIGLLLADLIRKAVLTTCQSLGIPSAKMISSFVFYFILINVVLVSLNQAGIDTDFLASNISIVLGGVVLAFGLGYGLASKNIFSNMLSSFYDKDRLKVGETITMGSRTGKIIDVDKSSVTLKTEKGRLVIPLHKISEQEVEIHE
ncbi:MAG: mechanosensitive ion channel [Saprospiraceae bacterium]|nr:mechanosensitive ion channel [Saprospiraceae bacterium]